MILDLKYDNFRRCKGVYQHYYLDCALSKNTIFEFEKNKYKIIFQVPEDADEPGYDMMKFNLYPAALEICGGNKVKSHFFDAIKDAIEVKADQGFRVEAEVVGCGEARNEGVTYVKGTACPIYALGEMVVTIPISWLRVHVQLKEPIDVRYRSRVYQLQYEETLMFAVEKID